MLQNFPFRRGFMAPVTTSHLSLSNQELSSYSGHSSTKPTRVGHEASCNSASLACGDRDQLQPILRDTSVTVKAKDKEKWWVDRFEELFRSLESADVTIMCGRNHDTLKAHQFVLSVGSEYFRDALKVAQCEHPVVVIKNVTGEVMSRILEYIYLGNVTLQSESELKQFVNSAKYLLVFGIQDEQYSVTNHKTISQT